MASEHKVVLAVDGMGCQKCVATVTGALSSIAGVLGVDVDLGAGRVTVRVSCSADPASLVEALERAGYTTRAI